MKKNIFILIGTLLFFASTVFAMGASPDPQILVSPEAWDLGKIPQQSKHTQLLEVYNIGGKPLLISNVRTSCGCTTTQISTKEILSGQKATMEVSFFSGNFKGINTKKVYITSNDPKIPTFTFTLTAEVVSIEVK